MKRIYLDNAATTPMLPEVIDEMREAMLENFGNPSSTHQHGRKAKVAIETARKNIANYFNVPAKQIVFTSGGTESNNLILFNAVKTLGVKRIITSKIEHHAVLDVVLYLQEWCNIVVDFVKLDEYGKVNLDHLEVLLKSTSDKTLVSLMMINNEIGNLLAVEKVSNLCKTYKALFHSDTVQVIGHYALDLQNIPIDFIVGSAHKFHGPKGVGFLYYNKDYEFKSMFYGGGQERGVRSGTENVYAILGMDKAITIAYKNMEKNNAYVLELKEYFIKRLKESYPEIEFNGMSAHLEESSSTILNVKFPFTDKMLLFNLDLQGVSCSLGSACQSGAQKGSHVLKEILNTDEDKKTSIRFSFCRWTNKSELDEVLLKLKAITNRYL